MYIILPYSIAIFGLGFTTDGEFNSLRWKGQSRPLTVLEIKSAVRSTYQRRGFKSLMSMLTPIGTTLYLGVNSLKFSFLINTVTPDGQIVAKKENPAVSRELLLEINDWKLEGANDADVLCRLRQRTIPTGYSHHFWCPGNQNIAFRSFRIYIMLCVSK